MSKKEYETPDDNPSPERLREADRQDPLDRSGQVISQEIPPGADRRTFLMRSALIGATAIITGRPVSAQERTARSQGTPPKPPLSPDLAVVKQEK